MGSVAGRVGGVFVQTEDAPEVFTDEAAAPDLSLTRYTISDSAKRYWDKNLPVTVKVNGEVQFSGYQLEHCGGVVVFDEAKDGDDVVLISGSALVVEQHGGFFNWSAELGMETPETTTFMSNGWKEYISSVKEYSASAESYWGDEEFFSRLGQEVIIALYIDTTASKTRYEGYGIISSDGIETAADDVVNDSIEIQGVGPLYYREG
ncbi:MULTISPECIES: hypothetical protein [Pseudobacteroides]|uniref:Uncharacterized protein n=1 Tax=Pseudobacteroides cellulosolvens ATCC 35603 = DSM 2933 TaxID=398512 RepID=A0A0L6JT51_9FIRM|nr:hypothetical protein [Pseudobacteroides cellulosolvens]KNY29026.1 hypothetical protein Bccel_4300 [Pseudobacteroides cellulosolvens ATCC 35603 = DSM 2933]